MIIAANWKMNLTQKQAVSLINSIANNLNTKNNILIFPSFTLIETVKKLTSQKTIFVGAQDCSVNSSGAYTGEVSAEQVKDSGCNYVILGHSERRKYHNETDLQINKKAKLAIKSDLTPLICIGETLEQRKTNQTIKVIKAQLDEIYTEVDASRTIIAYEPVWAIGTGLTAKNEEIIEVHNYINDYFSGKVRILYGGSVNEQNSDEILALKNVSGVLVGGASLVAEKFIKIANFLQK
ncbi:MAG TPA: triose-phosphate isomerase [Alphaproteobacteria bacterium]|nr:triose-phosphate isomerase [Alphaproteobacteria bacterium]